MANRNHVLRSLIIAIAGLMIFLSLVPVIVSSTFLPAWIIALLVTTGLVIALWLIIKNIF